MLMLRDGLGIQSSDIGQGCSAMVRYKAPMTPCLVAARFGRGHLMRVVFQQQRVCVLRRAIGCWPSRGRQLNPALGCPLIATSGHFT